MSDAHRPARGPLALLLLLLVTACRTTGDVGYKPCSVTLTTREQMEAADGEEVSPATAYVISDDDWYAMQGDARVKQLAQLVLNQQSTEAAALRRSLLLDLEKHQIARGRTPLEVLVEPRWLIFVAERDGVVRAQGFGADRHDGGTVVLEVR